MAALNKEPEPSVVDLLRRLIREVKKGGLTFCRESGSEDEQGRCGECVGCKAAAAVEAFLDGPRWADHPKLLVDVGATISAADGRGTWTAGSNLPGGDVARARAVLHMLDVAVRDRDRKEGR